MMSAQQPQHNVDPNMTAIGLADRAHVRETLLEQPKQQGGGNTETILLGGRGRLEDDSPRSGSADGRGFEQPRYDNYGGRGGRDDYGRADYNRPRGDYGVVDARSVHMDHHSRPMIDSYDGNRSVRQEQAYMRPQQYDDGYDQRSLRADRGPYPPAYDNFDGRSLADTRSVARPPPLREEDVFDSRSVARPPPPSYNNPPPLRHRPVVDQFDDAESVAPSVQAASVRGRPYDRLDRPMMEHHRPPYDHHFDYPRDNQSVRSRGMHHPDFPQQPAYDEFRHDHPRYNDREFHHAHPHDNRMPPRGGGYDDFHRDNRSAYNRDVYMRHEMDDGRRFNGGGGGHDHRSSAQLQDHDGHPDDHRRYVEGENMSSLNFSSNGDLSQSRRAHEYEDALDNRVSRLSGRYDDHGDILQPREFDSRPRHDFPEPFEVGSNPPAPTREDSQFPSSRSQRSLSEPRGGPRLDYVPEVLVGHEPVGRNSGYRPAEISRRGRRSSGEFPDDMSEITSNTAFVGSRGNAFRKGLENSVKDLAQYRDFLMANRENRKELEPSPQSNGSTNPRNSSVRRSRSGRVEQSTSQNFPDDVSEISAGTTGFAPGVARTSSNNLRKSLSSSGLSQSEMVARLSSPPAQPVITEIPAVTVLQQPVQSVPSKSPPPPVVTSGPAVSTVPQAAAPASFNDAASYAPSVVSKGVPKFSGAASVASQRTKRVPMGPPVVPKFPPGVQAPLIGKLFDPRFWFPPCVGIVISNLKGSRFAKNRKLDRHTRVKWFDSVVVGVAETPPYYCNVPFDAVFWSKKDLAARRREDIEDLDHMKEAQSFNDECEAVFEKIQKLVDKFYGNPARPAITAYGELDIPIDQLASLMTPNVVMGAAFGYRGIELGGLQGRRERTEAVAEAVREYHKETMHHKKKEARRKRLNMEVGISLAAEEVSVTDRYWSRLVALADELVEKSNDYSMLVQV